MSGLSDSSRASADGESQGNMEKAQQDVWQGASPDQRSFFSPRSVTALSYTCRLLSSAACAVDHAQKKISDAMKLLILT